MALTKVFRIEMTGGKDVEKDILAIKKAMSSMATAIAKAKGELAELVSTKADPGAISSLTAKISDLEAKMKSLSQERKKAETDAKRQAEAEKILADAKLKEAQASKAQEQAELARTQAQIAQEKELDRQIALEQKEQKELEKKKKALDALPNSYLKIKESLAQLKPFIQSGGAGDSVNFQGKQINFDQAVSEFKKLSFAEQDFRRQFQKDGTLVGEYASGIANAFKRLGIDDIIKNNLDGGKKAIGDLEKKTNDLVVAYRRAQQSGSADLNKLEKEIHDNVVETEALRKKVQEAEVQLRGINGVGGQITNSLNKNFKELKNSIGQFALTYVGFQAIFSGLQSGIDNAKELSDQTTNLEVELGKASGGAQGLVDQLGKLNTRTKLNVLEDIANIAAKAGVGEQQLAGVTQAIDKIKIAFGKDFGDVEQGTESLVKLINIFLGPGAVTGDNLLKMGNAIRTLANESVASVPFLNDFSKRMAGLKGISDISLPSVLGLASGFEQFGQSAETSSTALVKIVPKLAEDTEKFSKIAGVTREEFSKLLKNNPAEALLKVSEGLVKGKGSLEEFAAAFKDTELGTGRVESVIGVLGKNTEQFRKSIDSAGRAFNDTSNIETAFSAKNENLAATLDKIGKRFADAAGGKAFQVTLLAIGTAITFLLANLPLLLTLGSLLAINWAVQNSQLLLLRVQVLGYNIAIGASYVAMGVLTIVQTAYNVVLFITNGALTLVSRALAFFGVTVKATTGPLGVILTVISLLAAAFVAFGRTMEDAQGSLSEFVRLQRINLEISREANKATGDQIATLDGWIAVVKSAATSADTKRKAMQKLIEINPAFRSALQGETIDLNALDVAYGKVVQSIQAKARAEAAATLSAGKQKKVTEIAALRQDLEIQVAQDTRGQSITNVELTDEQIELLKNSNLQNTGAIAAFVGNRAQIFRSRFDQVKKFLDKKEKEAISIYQDYLKAQAQAEENLTKAEEQVQKTPAIEPTETVFQIFDRLLNNNGTGSDFKALLKKIQEQKKITAVTSKEYQNLLALEKKVRELIKPKAGSGGGSRSPEKQKLDDKLKEIEAGIVERKNALDEQLADGLISERYYYVQVRDNTTNGEQQKIDIILEYQQKYKKALAKFDGELAKDIADAGKKQVQAKRETNRKLFEVDNKQLEINLRNEEIAAERARDTALLNPNLSNEQKLQIEEDYQNRLLKARAVFNQQQIDLEKLYAIASIENEQKRKEAIDKLIQELNKAEHQRPEAQIKDIQAAGDRQVREFNTYYSKLRTAILENNRITEKERKRQLDALDKSEKRTILSAQLATLNIEVKKQEELLKKGLTSVDEYLKAVEAQKKKAEELAGVTGKALDTFDASFSGFIDSISNLAGIGDLAQKEIGDSGISVGFVVAQSWDIAKTALQGYFQARQETIEKEKQAHLDELDRERERVKSRASSKAEEDAIDRQYAQKKRKVEQQAGEDLKKQKRSEAKIALAAELANIAVQAAANPANAVSFGTAGALQFAILSALALGRYVLRVGEINKQQFGFGGTLKKKEYGFGGKANEVPVTGGKFGGKSHSRGGTDFAFNGNNYNAEVDELSVIRTKNAPRNKVYTITGNHTQIASALNNLGGGTSFSPGAAVNKFAMGGALGSRLKAPTFSANYYLNGGNVGGGQNNNSDLQELKELVAEVAAAVYSTDAKPVVLNPHKVTEAQEKKKKDVSVATI